MRAAAASGQFVSSQHCSARDEERLRFLLRMRQQEQQAAAAAAAEAAFHDDRNLTMAAALAAYTGSRPSSIDAQQLAIIAMARHDQQQHQRQQQQQYEDALFLQQQRQEQRTAMMMEAMQHYQRGESATGSVAQQQLYLNNYALPVALNPATADRIAYPQPQGNYMTGTASTSRTLGLLDAPALHRQLSGGSSSLNHPSSNWQATLASLNAQYSPSDGGVAGYPSMLASTSSYGATSPPEPTTTSLLGAYMNSPSAHTNQQAYHHHPSLSATTNTAPQIERTGATSGHYEPRLTANVKKAARKTTMVENYDPGIVKALSLPTDKGNLSEYQCLLREQIFLFAVGPSDIHCTAQGRNKPITLGQVGVLCRHCAKMPPGTRPSGAVYFPAKLSGLYQASQNMAINHFGKSCQSVPDHIRAMLHELKENKSTVLGGGKHFWANGARVIGVIEQDGQLRFKEDHET